MREVIGDNRVFVCETRATGQFGGSWFLIKYVGQGIPLEMSFEKELLCARAVYAVQAFCLGGIWNRTRDSQASFPNEPQPQLPAADDRPVCARLLAVLGGCSGGLLVRTAVVPMAPNKNPHSPRMFAPRPRVDGAIVVETRALS